MSPGLTTRLLHADRFGGAEHGAVHKPIHTTAAYAYPSCRDLVSVFQGEQPGYVYSRQGNPTGTALEAKISLLENASATVVFSTGMAAIAAVLFSLLRAGDHVISSQFLFGSTLNLLQTLESLGVELTLVDATDAIAVAHLGVLRAAYTLATGCDMATPMPPDLDVSKTLILSLAPDGAARLHALNVPLTPRKA